MCEGCWEVGGRGAWLSPSETAGADPSLGMGLSGLFRFRPSWAVELAYDRHPGSIPDGPNETFSFLTVTGHITFRSAREQRTRPYLLIGAGFAFDHISSGSVDVSLPGGAVTAHGEPASDHGLAYSLGGGSVTSLSNQIWLRLEAKWLRWSSYGLDQDSIQVAAGLWYRF